VVVAAEFKNLNLTYFCHHHTTASFVQKLVSCFRIFFLFLSFIHYLLFSWFVCGFVLNSVQSTPTLWAFRFLNLICVELRKHVHKI
jgi:hypothetical protein